MQCCMLHTVKDIPVSQLILMKGREERVRTADVNWPNGYSMLYDIMQKENSQGSESSESSAHCGANWALVSGW